VMRIRDPKRAARHLKELVAATASSSWLGPTDRLLLGVGVAMAERLPRTVMPLVAARLRTELAGYVISAEPGPLGRHIARRRAQGIDLNLNVLGEAVLGDGEADHRLAAVLDLLARPDVDYVSVKVSSVCAQLNIVAFDHEVERVSNRLRRLYDAAMASKPYKFVNLDMEEYRDLQLTVAVFKAVLDQAPYDHLEAGIVLQAYVPDSLAALEELIGWARRRHELTGAAIKVRIVKGANLAMEQVEAELAGWPQAPFLTKAESDANYKRMLDAVLDPQNEGAVRLGVASHNLFELGWALSVAAERGLAPMIEAEMLEGMAGPTAVPLRDAAGSLLLYAPIVRRSDSESAIAYLVRRFDENTGPDNFLRHQFGLTVGSATWNAERDRFRASVTASRQPAPPTRRVQDRGREEAEAGLAKTAAADRRPGAPGAPGAPEAPEAPGEFANEPDTDVAIAANRRWLGQWLERAASGTDLLPAVVPAVVAGRTVEAPARGEGRDPSRPDEISYRWVQADIALVDEAVACARQARAAWRAISPPARRAILEGVADALAGDRGRLIATMAADGGKTFAQADPEVSEAIDFARYYGTSLEAIETAGRRGAHFEPYGTVVVVPPWNFPLAIPAGGVLGALAAGATVILKPAPETVATAWALAQACWAGGVPKDVLQFVPCADDDAGRRLITHPDVDAVILTGAWDTARLFASWRPQLALHAETSGKNAIVVTATADLDGAVADLVSSAFGHAGQKCSAASLAIVEASVYDDAPFRRQLADAARSLRPGPAWEKTTTLGPLIRPPEGPLATALRRLDRGESWLLEPVMVGGNPQLWSPGIKLGVRPGSEFHLTECFGPVLGLMRAADLDEAIAWQNQPAYGLTAGLHALDPGEIGRWRDRVQAGNLYVNRHITGAIVRRQSFGGWRRSVVGPGAKAGGPNYVGSLGHWKGSFVGTPDSFGAGVRRVWEGEMAPVDLTGLAAESNVLRYRPIQRVLIRAGADSEDGDVALAIAAGRALDVTITVSSPVQRDLTAPTVVEDEDTLSRRLPGLAVDKVRLVGAAGDGLRLAVHDAGLWLDDTPIVADAAVEAIRWAREQAVSETLHRHGNVTGRYHPGSS
jgi:RHH-type proline utilization regulon transcriptional repressor/proline dehydrogenase/delta 1-pyrroline-5-carboxylate dehydrogenase